MLAGGCLLFDLLSPESCLFCFAFQRYVPKRAIHHVNNKFLDAHTYGNELDFQLSHIFLEAFGSAPRRSKDDKTVPVRKILILGTEYFITRYTTLRECYVERIWYDHYTL